VQRLPGLPVLEAGPARSIHGIRAGARRLSRAAAGCLAPSSSPGGSSLPVVKWQHDCPKANFSHCYFFCIVV
jgi:hypothetical protein